MSSAVSVQIEGTPNPATLKFKFSQTLLDRTMDFPSAGEAERSPLAQKLWGFPWTAGVFMGPDFVTVTKQDWVDWDVLAEPLAGLIKEHLDNGEALYIDLPEKFESDEKADDTPIVREIKSILNREIRPVVALDGGDIEFAKFEDDVLYIHMKGSCAGCPSSTATLKEGIEVRFKELLPQIKEVVAV